MLLFASWLWLGLAGEARAADAPTIVLLSLDTTRADALSCYGRLPGLLSAQPVVATPHLDALADQGLRFERFYAHAPTTLSSHTSMLSGRDPHEHWVPRNGFPVPAAVNTLPSRLAEAGYDTIAVVGARALEAPMGLDRGFRVYDDTTPNLRTVMYQDTADNVVSRAIDHTRQRPDPSAPLFLFVHLYDAHAPYEAPEPYRSDWAVPDYTGPYKHTMQGRLGPMRRALSDGVAQADDIAQLAGMYQAEVAFVDAQVDRLLDALRAEGLLDNALVVVTADHGESLHDDVKHAYMHGPTVGEEVMHVPLILWSSGPALGRGLVTRAAGMSGLAPTIEAVVGLEPLLGQGFYDLVRPGPRLDSEGWPGRPSIPVPMEATRPHLGSPPGWNNLPLPRAVLVSGSLLERDPTAWFWDTELVRGDPMLAPLLADWLAEWDRSAPPFQEAQLADETRAALEALGYLDAGEN